MEKCRFPFHATGRERCEPQIIKKRQRRFDGFDDLILSLYSRGLSTREIQSHIEEIYGVEVSPDLISTVTSAVEEKVREWQQRALDEVYPILYLDALRVKIRFDGRVSNRCVYIAIGGNLEGRKETLGLWSAENEGARILAVSFNGASESRRKRYSDRLCRWLERFSRRDRIGVSEHFSTNLHCASNQKLTKRAFLIKSAKRSLPI